MSRKITIRGSTTDSEIAAALTSEEILGRFVAAKEHANVWDTERDRLRKFIQEHMESGRYGKFVLDLKEGTPRVTATSLGNQALQSAVVVDVGLIPKRVKAGTKVIVVDKKTAEVLVEGVVLDNGSLYSRKPPINVNIVEIPEEDSQP